MRSRFLLAALLALPLVAAEGRAQSYTLTVKDDPGVGKSIVFTETRMTHANFSISAGGLVLKEDKKVEVEEMQYTAKILEAGGKQPKKIARTYARAVKGNKDSLDPLAYHGETVVLELKGDRYEATLQSGAVSDPKKLKELQDLARSARKDSDIGVLLLKTPVQVGDAWPISAEDLGAAIPDLKDTADLTKAKVQCKFVKAYKKDDKQWGTVELSINVPITKLGSFPLSKPIPFEMTFIIDTAIDGSSTAYQWAIVVTIKGTSEFSQNNMTYTVVVDMSSKGRAERSAEK
jgi:hypothetical protein